MIPLKGRQIFHRFCRLSTKYDEKNADKNFTYCLKRTNGKVTIRIIVYLCRTHGMDMEAVRQRLIESQQNSETAQQRNSVILLKDDEAEAVEVTCDTDPETPLPTFGNLHLPYPLDLIYERGQIPQQCDAMLLTALTVMGAAMDWLVRTKYSDYFQYPCLQLFVMAPSASGKGAMARVRQLASGILELRLSDDQMDDFDSHFSSFFEEGQLALNGELDSTVIPQAINAVRIMSIVAALREFEKHDGAGLTKALVMGRDTNGQECNLYYLSISDDDFLDVLTIFEALYQHSIHVLFFLKSTETERRVLSGWMLVLNEMYDEFTREEWNEECDKRKINKGTARVWIGRLLKKGMVTLDKETGKYTKTVKRKKE